MSVNFRLCTYLCVSNGLKNKRQWWYLCYYTRPEKRTRKTITIPHESIPNSSPINPWMTPQQTLEHLVLKERREVAELVCFSVLSNKKEKGWSRIITRDKGRAWLQIWNKSIRFIVIDNCNMIYGLKISSYLLHIVILMACWTPKLVIWLRELGKG